MTASTTKQAGLGAILLLALLGVWWLAALRLGKPYLLPPPADVASSLLASVKSGTLLPAIKEVSGVEFAGVCTATGPRAQHAAQKFGFRYCTTDADEILRDPEVDTVLIATRHNLHARQTIAAAVEFRSSGAVRGKRAGGIVNSR